MPDHKPHVSVFSLNNPVSRARIRKYTHATERGMCVANENDQMVVGVEKLQGVKRPAGVQIEQMDPTSMEPPPKRQKIKLKLKQVVPYPDESVLTKPNDGRKLKRTLAGHTVVPGNDRSTIKPKKERKLSSVLSSDISSLSPAPSSDRASTGGPTVESETKSKLRKQDYGTSFASYYIQGDDENETQETAVAQPIASKNKERSPKMVSPKVEESRHRSTKLRLPTRPSASTQASPAPTSAKVPKKSTQQSRATISHPSVPEPQPQRTSGSESQPLGQPSSSEVMTRLPPLPHPSVDLVDDIPRASESREPDSVETMIEKLEASCEALKKFISPSIIPDSRQGGKEHRPTSSCNPVPSKVPLRVSSFSETLKSVRQKPSSKAKGAKNTAVDKLLAVCGDKDSYEGSEQDTNDSDESGSSDGSERSQSPSAHTGIVDSSLVYGIQFIQNALKSWAYQRLNQQYADHYWQMVQHALAQLHPPPQKRGPGRPRKFPKPRHERPLPHMPPPVVRMLLSGTPEGAAIVAFQEILDYGCLRLNAIIPTQLSRALLRLYKQMDHLINNQGKTEEPWRCMSYSVQIENHRARVEDFKAQQAKAQEIFLREQCAPEHIAHQMAVPHQFLQRVDQMPPVHVQKAYAAEMERLRRVGGVGLHQQINQYNRDSESRSSQFVGPPFGPLTMQMQPNNMLTGPTSLHKANSITHSTTRERDNDPMHAPVPGYQGNFGVAQEDVNLSSPGQFPRTGQKFQFSFIPRNKQALEVFGPRAFPGADATPPQTADRTPISISSSPAPIPSKPLPVSATDPQPKQTQLQTKVSPPPPPEPEVKGVPPRCKLAAEVNGDHDGIGENITVAPKRRPSSTTPAGKNGEPLHHSKAAKPTVKSTGFTSINAGRR